ncbi:MAG: hypothetical protein ACR2GN_07775 [Bacteroidia bacterium]
MDGKSKDILRDNLETLKQLFPMVFTEGQLDLEKFKATFSDDININNERYVLNWAGKADAFKVLQIPTTATLKPRYRKAGISYTGFIFYFRFSFWPYRLMDRT